MYYNSSSYHTDSFAPSIAPLFKLIIHMKCTEPLIRINRLQREVIYHCKDICFLLKTKTLSVSGWRFLESNMFSIPKITLLCSHSIKFDIFVLKSQETSNQFQITAYSSSDPLKYSKISDWAHWNLSFYRFVCFSIQVLSIASSMFFSLLCHCILFGVIFALFCKPIFKQYSHMNYDKRLECRLDNCPCWPSKCARVTFEW